ncbi:MAG: phosphopantothenate/pantothenate synthetase [Thaumarchaeota archaeon]|nr:phosphopantothenate/pantothenate synthetase [Nitrososphaerota archaeon]
MLTNIPYNHPRAGSLHIREMMVEGLRNGIVAHEGLIAHGRGEAFDYLIGEKTTKEAVKAMKSAVALMLLAERKTISVNGNTACLCAKEIVELAEVTVARIEVNLFHRSVKRETAIEKLLIVNGAKNILGVDSRTSVNIPKLMSDRRRIDPEGIYEADVVLIPLEDGDRTEALVKMGKNVITIDLNPLSRTARKANMTIVDNVIRVMPKMIELAKQMKKMNKSKLKRITHNFDNKKNLSISLQCILKGLKAN